MLAAVLKTRALGTSALLVGVGVALLVGCSQAGAPDSGAIANDRRAIVNGEVSGPEDDAVVQVIAKTPTVTYSCTGTLIAHNLVITARHCISDFEDLPFSCTDGGDLVPSSPGGRMKALYSPSQVSVHIKQGPKAVLGAQAVQFFAADTPSMCRNDLALIVLDRELSDLPIEPIRLKKGTLPGEVLRVAGYGVDETGNSGIRHTLSGLIVTRVGPSIFRSPGDSVPPRTFVTDGSALCIGDSGGPAFIDDTVIAGVWSQVVNDCMSSAAHNYFTEAAPFADAVILPAFEAAGAEPWYEGTTGPGIDPGTTGGTVGTGGGAGAGNAGGDDSPTGGDGMGEGGTPSTGGIGGSADTGGSVSTGGRAGTGGDEPGTGGSALGGSAASASGGNGGEGGGLRKKGGCTCGVFGAPTGRAGWLLPTVVALALRRRRRSR
jgi:MYXO-CTERM domain-containing protein